MVEQHARHVQNRRGDVVHVRQDHDDVAVRVELEHGVRTGQIAAVAPDADGLGRSVDC